MGELLYFNNVITAVSWKIVLDSLCDHVTEV